MASKDERLALLLKYLRDPKNVVGVKDPVEKHQRAVEGIWIEALRLTDGDVARALDLVREAVKSDRRKGETESEYKARLDAIPSLAFGPAGTKAQGVDKLQHFFGSAWVAYTWGVGPSTNLGRIWERLDQVKDLLGMSSGGYDMGDVHADDLGAEFGGNLLPSPTTSVRFFVRHPGETLGGAIQRLAGHGIGLRVPGDRRPGVLLPTGAGRGPGSGGRPTRGDSSGRLAPARNRQKVDPQAPPPSTGIDPPSRYFDANAGTFGPPADGGGAMAAPAILPPASGEPWHPDPHQELPRTPARVPAVRRAQG
jgi:hypothetical protein